jgi:predicted RNase H-like nuclease (RuvC/YqgF family)
MANGRDAAKVTVAAFEAWKATQDDDSYSQIIYRGSLSRSEICKAIDCGRSALRQNPELKRQLDELEDNLRKRNVLPPLTAEAKAKKADTSPKLYSGEGKKLATQSNRLQALEVEVIDLRAKNAELERELSRLKELSDVVSELGMIPR